MVTEIKPVHMGRTTVEEVINVERMVLVGIAKFHFTSTDRGLAYDLIRDLGPVGERMTRNG